MKMLVIIPAYNEQENIRKTIRDIKDNCPDVDFLVVNDCSRDQTEQILRDDDICYVTLPCNLGIGGGVQTGYRYACENGYDIAIQFDGDGQHEAKYLANMISPIENGQADIVVGSRYITKTGFQSTGIRRAGIGFLSFLIRMLCGIKVLDVTSGMRAVNRRFIEIYAQDYAQDYPEPEALVAAAVKGASIMEVSVEMRDRQGGSSSISPMRSIYYMIKVSLALILARFSS